MICIGNNFEVLQRFCFTNFLSSDTLFDHMSRTSYSVICHRSFQYFYHYSFAIELRISLSNLTSITYIFIHIKLMKENASVPGAKPSRKRVKKIQIVADAYIMQVFLKTIVLSRSVDTQHESLVAIILSLDISFVGFFIIQSWSHSQK